MLCAVCTRVVSAEDFTQIVGRDESRKPHHQTFAGLARSVEDGCYICNRLWVITDLNADSESSLWLPSGPDRGGDRNDTSTYSEAQFFTSFTFSDGALVGQEGCFRLRAGLNFDVIPPGSKAALYEQASFSLQPYHGPSSNAPTEELSATTYSPSTLALAKKWILNCTKNHPQCNAPATKTQPYPSRLLDCGVSEPSSDTRYRLVETPAHPVTGPYMTLSHSWGTADCLKLTTENYGRLMDGFPLSDLPQLYQDTVLVAHNLGIRYLWIDSLCILQSGTAYADWLKEVSLMSEIYSNSFCNISAADSSSGHDSMFRHRYSDAQLPQVVDIVQKGVSAQYLISDKLIWETEVSSALVNTRAWVMQERILSPRIVYFGARQIAWECRQMDAVEIYPEGLPSFIAGTQGTRFKNLVPRPRRRASSGNTTAGYRVWSTIVEAYTGSGLTFPSDKLPAISAVAKLMKTLFNDQYVAGMWRRSLEHELIWSTGLGPPRKSTDLQAYRAPSWSWASIDGPVNAGFISSENKELLIKVENVELEHATDDDTGVITGGWLTLWGVLKRLVLLPHQTPGETHVVDWDMIVDGELVTEPADTIMQDPQPHVFLDRSHDDFHQQNHEGSLYCMVGRASMDGQGTIYTLLFELSDRGNGLFRRIGIAYGRGRGVSGKLLKPALNVDELPCEDQRDGRQLIRVI